MPLPPCLTICMNLMSEGTVHKLTMKLDQIKIIRFNFKENKICENKQLRLQSYAEV